jgi:6,7-dimethyl-8-ribityllumazine synthase
MSYLINHQLVHARWNVQVIDALLKGAVETLLKYNIKKENIRIQSVPGSFELPYATKKLLSNYDAAISIGVLIKGMFKYTFTQ